MRSLILLSALLLALSASRAAAAPAPLRERIDAFLRAELAHALGRLGRAADAQVERGQADALIEALDDAEITAWYRRRVARQQALDTGA